MLAMCIPYFSKIYLFMLTLNLFTVLCTERFQVHHELLLNELFPTFRRLMAPSSTL